MDFDDYLDYIHIKKATRYTPPADPLLEILEIENKYRIYYSHDIKIEDISRLRIR